MISNTLYKFKTPIKSPNRLDHQRTGPPHLGTPGGVLYRNIYHTIVCNGDRHYRRILYMHHKLLCANVEHLL